MEEGRKKNSAAKKGNKLAYLEDNEKCAIHQNNLNSAQVSSVCVRVSKSHRELANVVNGKRAWPLPSVLIKAYWHSSRWRVWGDIGPVKGNTLRCLDKKSITASTCWLLGVGWGEESGQIIIIIITVGKVYVNATLSGCTGVNFLKTCKKKFKMKNKDLKTKTYQDHRRIDHHQAHPPAWLTEIALQD